MEKLIEEAGWTEEKVKQHGDEMLNLLKNKIENNE